MTAPLPKMTGLVERLTDELVSSFRPGEPVNDAALDAMVAHLRAFQQLASAVDAELMIFRELQAEAEKQLRASLHEQPERMQ